MHLLFPPPLIRLFGEYSGFYNGTKLPVGTDINYPKQHWGNFGINYHFNRVELANDFGSQNIHLIESKAEIAFTQGMFLTSLQQ